MKKNFFYHKSSTKKILCATLRLLQALSASAVMPCPTALAASPSEGTLAGSFRSLDAFLSFLGAAAGRTALVATFFLLIILFLRFLYGPRGVLREPRWDELNKEFKTEEAEHKHQENMRRLRLSRQDSLHPVLEREKAVFVSYAQSFLTGNAERDAMFRLKLEHSLRVLDFARNITELEPSLWPKLTEVKDEKAFEPDRALLLAALYHDLGRFEQLRQYHSFRDADSINHGELSAVLLDGTWPLPAAPDNAPFKFMEHEPPLLRAAVIKAVRLHNRSALPEGISPETPSADERPVCLALRDADKLDIMRVMAAELKPGHATTPTIVLNLSEEPDKYTRAILDTILAGGYTSYEDMRYVNDFRILLCGWVNAFAFEASRKILAQANFLTSIMAGLPETEKTAELKNVVLQRLEHFDSRANSI